MHRKENKFQRTRPYPTSRRRTSMWLFCCRAYTVLRATSSPPRTLHRHTDGRHTATPRAIYDPDRCHSVIAAFDAASRAALLRPGLCVFSAQIVITGSSCPIIQMLPVMCFVPARSSSELDPGTVQQALARAFTRLALILAVARQAAFFLRSV
jgi:hypothetical protein